MQDGVKFDLLFIHLRKKYAQTRQLKMAAYAHAQTVTFKIMWKHKKY